jgi:ribonuclease P protein component
MKRRFRLRRADDFQQVLKGQRVHVGQALVAFCRPSQRGEPRVGVAVSRQLKGSVRRNLARRRLREAARRRLLANDSADPSRGIPYDVVLIARPAALTLPAAELELEVAAVRAKLPAPGRPEGSRDRP